MTATSRQSPLTQVDAAARRKTEFQQDGVHLAPDAALLIAPDGTIADLNHYAEELFGYERAELLGQSLSLLIPERFRDAHAHHFAHYRNEPRPRAMGWGMDLWGLRKDGSEFPVDIALTPRQTPEGLHVLCSIRDLSARLEHAIEEQLRFQTLVTDISARFTGPVLDHVDEEITGAIRGIVEFLGADRGSFGEFSASNSLLTVTHTYNVPGIPPVPRTVMNDRLPWLAGQLQRGEVIRLERIPEDLPTEASREREYFSAEGMKAGLAIPLKAGSEFAFGIGVSSFRCERKWPPGVIARLQLLGEIFINALTRRRLRDALQEQLAFEKLVVDISARFASLAIQNIDAEITLGLREVAEFLGVDRSGFGECRRDEGTLVSTHFYAAPGIPPPPEVVRNEFPWWVARLWRGEMHRHARLPDDLPPEAGREREYVLAVGMKSHLSMPIDIGGSATYFFTAESFSAPREWPDAFVQRLRLLGEIFANALMRKHALLALQESESKFRLLAETATCGIGIYQDGRFQYVSPRATEITGYSPDELLSLNVEQLVHPDSRALVLERTERRLRGEPVPPRYEIKILTKQGEERCVDFTAAVTQYRGKPAIIGTAFDVTQQRHAQEALQELGGRLIRAQEDERARVARELHDDLSQRLALLAIELEQTGQQVVKSAPEEGAALKSLWEQTREIGTDIHRISRQLHPSQLEALGLVSALRSYCAEFSKQKGLQIEFNHDGILREISEDVTLCLYRIVQESLANASQHGRARRIDISLMGRPDAIQLTVVDDGIGFDVAVQASSPGLGLVSMRERARLVEGEFSIRSEPKQGTRIEVRVPLAGHAL